jgi:hypothetical protein
MGVTSTVIFDIYKNGGSVQLPPAPAIAEIT